MSFTLYIKTNNPYLKEAYAKRANHEDDSGVDLYFPDDGIIPAMYNNKVMTSKIDFEIKCQMKLRDKPIAYMLVPRSSISKTGLRMANSIGIIDRGYRGNIMAAVDNFGHAYHVKQGERLFQIISPNLAPLKVVVLGDDEELEDTERGAGGFGSTGN
jgi:dUTP pyrophosphatase